MFGKLFKKKSPIEKLEAKRRTLLEEAFNLSKTDRKASDDKTAETEEIQKQIDELYKTQS